MANFGEVQNENLLHLFGGACTNPETIDFNCKRLNKIDLVFFLMQKLMLNKYYPTGDVGSNLGK